MLRRPAVAAVLLCLLAAVFAARTRASGPQFWRLEGAKAFLEGDPTGVSVDSQGRLRLGSEPRQVYDPVAPNAWSVARDASGVLYVGTGNDGRVMKVQGTSGSVFFDSEELEVHAVAVGPDGRVYAGTSPDGAVYAIDPSGKATRFFDPQDKYIWALAFDPAGNLYVATGAQARVYKVAKDGKATTLLDSTDTHILSLAFDRSGQLYAGSAPEGILYRVGGDGHVFVVLDSQYREIRALDVAEDGTVYAAAVDAHASETPRPAAPASPPAPAAAPVAEVTVSESFAVVPPSGAAPIAIGSAAAQGTEAAAAPKGAVLRVRPNGDTDTFWTSTEDVPHSIACVPGGVLVGTGNKGKLYRVSSPDEWALVATVAAEQITALGRTSGAAAVLVTSNPARVYALEGTLAAQGTLVSKVKDAETAARWGQLSWEGSFPAGTSVEVQTRSGNTEHPDATWSEWSQPLTRAAGQPISSERARFMQLRLLLTGREGATPTVEAVVAAYLQRNLPPEVKTITVHPPGEVFQKPISVSGDPEILGLEPDPLSERAQSARAAAAGSPPAISFSRKMTQRGMRTFSWQGDDPNDDPLVYDVLYRAVGDERWRPLRRSLSEPVLAWDTTTVPNGRYLIRVVASDAPGNPPAYALSSSKDSTSFVVDNTPPSISASLDPARPGTIRATARDDSSPIRRLEYSVDAGRWEEVHPVDGIADSPEEQYEIALPPRSAGGAPRIVILRASDIMGNTATVRIDVP